MKNPRKLLFAGWGCEDRFYACYQNWNDPLKKIFPDMISFDTQKNIRLYGQDRMNKKFLELVKKEKPDYIYFWLGISEFYLETLTKIRELFPKTKLICFGSDDDLHFDSLSRYYALFFDYYIAGQILPLEIYKKEGIDAFITSGTNIQHFKPLNLKKIYEVTLIGTPNKDRYDLTKYLMDKGINIKIFGWGWHKYPDLKKIYGGPLSDKELVKKIDQSKINLCNMRTGFKTLNPIKGKILEIGATKGFLLTEYSPGLLKIFKEGKELAIYKNNKDALEKIKYYLKHEKEREKIAENLYKKIIREYDLYKDLKKFFNKIFKKENSFSHKPFPKINKKITLIEKKDLKLSLEKLKGKLRETDYVTFSNEKAKFLPYKDYLQAYSLEKSGKPISCCDYQVYSKNIGNYLVFKAKSAFMLLNREDFYSLLDVNQLMTTKEYFLKNIRLFQEFFNGRRINIINNQNTAFLQIPLLQISRLKKINYKDMKKVFHLRFMRKIETLFYQKKLFSNSYIYKIFLEGISGNLFPLRCLFDLSFDRNKINALKRILRKKITPQ